MTQYALGLDCGTDSIRALLVNVTTAEEVATEVVMYPRWKQGLYCDPTKDQFRQHPLDHLESLQEVVTRLLSTAPPDAANNIIGISFDTTCSTPIAVDKAGTALALKPEFAENPNAMFVLWKDHTAVKEALEITAAAKEATTNYLKYEGGIYSSEWFWAKALHILREDPAVRDAAYSWVEHCDWMTAIITDTTHPDKFRASRCAAGHKVMWHASWGGYPPNDFFKRIDPLLDGLRERLPAETFTSAETVGPLSEEWAEKLGLPAGIPIGFSAIDCHMGAVAANIKPGVLTKVMGTSTCDIAVASYNDIGDKCIRGICGQVDGSVVPGLVGLEAGQSAFGDLYAWFRDLVNWPIDNILQTSELLSPEVKSQLQEEIKDKTLAALGDAASKISPSETSVIALDWVNGRRTPDADQTVAMAIAGLKMGSQAPQIYRALVEATAFGAKAIIERFKEEGVAVDSVVATGGIAKKSDFVMQTCADIWNCSIDILESDQSCALGAAIFAATVGGAYPDVSSAQNVMASPICKTFHPDSEAAAKYDEIYKKYKTLGDFVNSKFKER